jgi:uncharacterized protein (DUF1697 family)
MALVIFLRGVNVGGYRTFRPTVIAEDLKAYDIVNIGAAGTFVVRKPASQAKLRSELCRRLPFESEVMICTAAELIEATKKAPFANEPVKPEIVRFVSVLAKRPRSLPALPAELPPDGRWFLQVIAVHGRFIFGQYRREMKAIGYLGALDKMFGMPATTRNWNTIKSALKLLSKE